MFELEKSGDIKGLQPYFQSLELLDSNTWFTRVFGDKVGAVFSRDYDNIRPQVPVLLSNTLADLMKRELTKPDAIKFEKACDSRATPPEYALLLARKADEPLYDVRFVQNGVLTQIPFFAYVKGGFRYIGNIQVENLGPDIQNSESIGPASKAQTSVERIRLGSNVMQKQLVCTVFPKYPEDAKAQHVQDTIVLHAVVDKNGCIRELEVVRGNVELAKSAFEAVRQWRYRPTLLNGRPVEVDTTITVVFTLGG